MLRTKRSRLSRGGWPRYSRRHSARSCGAVRSFRAASFCDNSAGGAGPITLVTVCWPSQDLAVGSSLTPGKLFRCFGDRDRARARSRLPRCQGQRMSHAACRRAFGAYRAPTTHSGPWPSGGGRDAIAAGSRVGLLRYFSARPSFFFTAPARKPRTLCFCQPVASSRSSIVAPSRRPSRPRHVCCLLCLPVAGLVPLRLPTALFLRRCCSGTLAVLARPLYIRVTLALGPLDRLRNSRLVNRVRFDHRVALRLGNRASCAVLPPPKAPH